ncbi:type II toxin-antitoxin system VapB family antitoxin [Segnochrobactrum spirostomi]|uniref:Type II toxin-antitoxin system VapB family antitoxin n=1 Tax=Segnochrobactrum spirostomi TaxID=2608987 RepID=A0A6A7Y5L1_9HYPH|nr:type II toxin-antitoxin system VapB family antitoxin [Segnochrobactrum spirostomi]MQT13371.1 type II toxin-antitoxin system VapB family antitoxin [Segnochrobactrum spirostomi]
MRTDIELDESLMREAMTLTGLKTATAVVEAALRALVEQSQRHRALDKLAGIGWQGDLGVLRDPRSSDPE